MTEETKQLRTNHNIRLVILATGETVLCLFGDVKDAEGALVGYKMIYPFVLDLGDPNEDGTLPIKYTKWCPFTPVQEFKLVGDHIISVTYPDNNILDSYAGELKSYNILEEDIFYEEETNGDNSEPDQVTE